MRKDRRGLASDIIISMTNLQIAELLRDVAAAYELQDAKRNFFRISAYQRAADAVEHATSEIKDLWDDGKLEEISGIGPSIAKHLDEIFRTGRSKHFEDVMKGLPKEMFELMEIPGIGVKTAFKLVSELNIESVSQLEEAARKGKIAQIEGFGKQSQTDILKAIKEARGRTKRLLLPYAFSIADEVIGWLNESKSAKRADPLGSLRRQASTVGDIDIAVATERAKEVLDHFSKYPKAQRILEKGEHTASIVVPGDVQVDLMVQPENSYGALLQHFTGSKHHNIGLREFALKRGYSLSEYGIRSLIDSKKQKAKSKKFATESEFYKYLGLEWIPPELRENTGEIEAARKRELPELISYKDIKGDLQIHSDFDIETSHDLGASSMQEVATKAQEMGYEYISFTEHNPSKSRHSEKQIVDILKRKAEVVEKLNYSLCPAEQDHALREKGMKNRAFYLFNSLEIDIMPGGGLPVPEAGLVTLDFALVSVHGSFRLERSLMTKRVISALSNPKVKIFAHPTARRLNEREGIELDWEVIFDFCLKKDKWLEINADPVRLDLPDTLVREAVKKGVMLTLGTDAHHVSAMDNMRWAVSVARRGWCEAKNIANTRSLEEFRKILKE